MDAVSATMLARVTTDVTKARFEILSGREKAAVELLGEALATLAGLERRFMEGKV